MRYKVNDIVIHNNRKMEILALPLIGSTCKDYISWDNECQTWMALNDDTIDHEATENYIDDQIKKHQKPTETENFKRVGDWIVVKREEKAIPLSIIYKSVVFTQKVNDDHCFICIRPNNEDKGTVVVEQGTLEELLSIL